MHDTGPNRPVTKSGPLSPIGGDESSANALTDEGAARVRNGDEAGAARVLEPADDGALVAGVVAGPELALLRVALDEVVAGALGPKALERDGRATAPREDGAAAERFPVPAVSAAGATGGEKQDGDGDSPHGAGVYASSGDVDKDGEVVGRLRPAIADGSAVDAEAQLAAVLRMLATAAAVRTAERASAGWSL